MIASRPDSPYEVPDRVEVSVDDIIGTTPRDRSGLPANLVALTALYDAALGNQTLHDIEHIAYLISSLLVWSTVLGMRHRSAPAAIGLAVLTMASLVFLGMILTTTERPLYDTYLELLGPDRALDDQRTGAAIMWLGSMLGLLPLTVWSVWRSAQREHDQRLLVEQLTDSRA